MTVRWSGPVSLTRFARNSNSKETTPCCNSVTGHQIASNFCTCHDITAFVPCTKFCSDHYIRTEVRVKRNFHRIWIAMEKPLVKRDPASRIRNIFHLQLWSPRRWVESACMMVADVLVPRHRDISNNHDGGSGHCVSDVHQTGTGRSGPFMFLNCLPSKLYYSPCIVRIKSSPSSS